jgi:hypothetical protein
LADTRLAAIPHAPVSLLLLQICFGVNLEPIACLCCSKNAFTPHYINMKYPRLLSSGANNKVIALSETEVAKLYTGDTRSDIGSEAEKLQFANTVNDLAAKFVRLDYHEQLAADMLVMERIYAIDYRSYEVEKRELWYDVFVHEMEQLHAAGFAHRDIERPADIGGEPFDNILLTVNGLRLIDVGISALRAKVGHQLFKKYIEIERKELEAFRAYFLTR